MKRAFLIFVSFTFTVPFATLAADHKHGSTSMNMTAHEQAASSQPEAQVQAEVRKINLDQGKVTLKHGPIKNLDMPGMTMAFRVKDKSILNGIAVGDRVIFTADRIENEIIVNSISKQ